MVLACQLEVRIVFIILQTENNLKRIYDEIYRKIIDMQTIEEIIHPTLVTVRSIKRYTD